MEFLFTILNSSKQIFGDSVAFGQYIQENIITLLFAAVVFIIITIILRSFFRIIIFVPLVIIAALLTFWATTHFIATDLDPASANPHNVFQIQPESN